jgi:hypothetical protein
MFLKLNTDASFLLNGKSYYRGILRDHKGNLVFYYHGSLKATSSIEAEFLAMLIGCRICKHLNLALGTIIVECDNSVLIDSINRRTCPLWYHVSKWIELIDYASKVHLFKHTFREANAVADYIAKSGKLWSNLNISFTTNNMTSICRKLIHLDQWDVPYFRICTKS